MVNELANLTAGYDRTDRALIERAYAVAEHGHKGQARASGEPYIIHPVQVATFLAGLGFDAATVAAALLHDVLEDTAVTRSQLASDFGEEVAFLVDGVTKLSSIKYSGTAKDKKSADLQTETLKKMFLAMAEDVRVIIIKLADRRHNMATLRYKEPASRTRIARETMGIYAPIAARLGMGRLKGELEDLAFPHAYPDEYSWLKKAVKGKYEDRLRYIERTAPVVARYLTDTGITVLDIHARAKRMWSLHEKLQRYQMDPDKVMDLVALRIIVPDIKSCYEALGVIHAHYKPMPGRIKDFIALPKPNGYQSLHTTVFCEKGRIAEIQIRTPQMHDHAENGIAAHWAYSEQGKRSDTIAKQQELAWINQLKSFLKDIKTSSGMANLKIDFFRNRIFVLTPQGDVKDLPEGATPLDFAYAVHSELGHRVTGALVNAKLVPLATALQSGDVVEIVKGNQARPSMDWLRLVKTTQATKHIKGWFKKHDPGIAVADGRALLNKQLAKADLSVERLNRTQINALVAANSVKTLDDLLTHISMGDFDAAVVARTIAPAPVRARRQKLGPGVQPTTVVGGTVVVDGQRGLAYKLGKCCSPTSNSAIVGYLTLTRGVTVHAQDCMNIAAAAKRRLLKTEWI